MVSLLRKKGSYLEMSKKILSESELLETIATLRNQERTKNIVLCHGVFDLVHPGHLEHFRQAKEYGEILIVSITADVYVNKGPNRPYFDQYRRARFLAALEVVDYVYIVNSASAIESINLVKPNFYVKGSDYRVISDDITGKIREEIVAVENFSGKVVFTDGFTSSSTSLINNALLSQDSEVRIWVSKFKEVHTLQEVLTWIDKLPTVDVNIAGETILDFYTNCKPLAKSSKDPILAFQRFETHKFMGGVLAIADSCSKWSRKVSVISARGRDFHEYFTEFENSVSYESEFLELIDRPTIIKHRFVDINSGNRVFEYYDYNPETLEESLQKRVIEKLSPCSADNSLLLLADYGHGFFGDSLVEYLCESSAFLAVNVQSNAGNRGFNTFSRYSRIDFLSLNGAELELALRKKHLNYHKVVPEIMSEKNCRYAIVTLGAEGLLTFDSSGKASMTPAFASRVVDKVGAGDSVLAIASMLAYLGAPNEVIGLLASIVAAYEVSQLGHKESLSLVDMKRFVNGILG